MDSGNDTNDPAQIPGANATPSRNRQSKSGQQTPRSSSKLLSTEARKHLTFVPIEDDEDITQFTKRISSLTEDQRKSSSINLTNELKRLMEAPEAHSAIAGAVARCVAQKDAENQPRTHYEPLRVFMQNLPESYTPASGLPERTNSEWDVEALKIREVVCTVQSFEPSIAVSQAYYDREIHHPLLKLSLARISGDRIKLTPVPDSPMRSPSNLPPDAVVFNKKISYLFHLAHKGMSDEMQATMGRFIQPRPGDQIFTHVSNKDGLLFPVAAPPGSGDGAEGERGYELAFQQCIAFWNRFLHPVREHLGGDSTAKTNVQWPALACIIVTGCRWWFLVGHFTAVKGDQFGKIRFTKMPEVKSETAAGCVHIVEIITKMIEHTAESFERFITSLCPLVILPCPTSES